MSKIDEIEVALELCARRPDRMNFSALKVMIAAALADAERKGAEAMREAAASAGFDAAASDENACEVMEAIEALPLPTGSQPAKAVRLTDEQLAAALCEIAPGDEQAADWTFVGWLQHRANSCAVLDEARLIQAAVLAANGLEALP